MTPVPSIISVLAYYSSTVHDFAAKRRFANNKGPQILNDWDFGVGQVPAGLGLGGGVRALGRPTRRLCSGMSLCGLLAG